MLYGSVEGVGRCKCYCIGLLSVGAACCFVYKIAQIVEFAVLLLVYYLLVAECCLCLRVPVYHTQATIDETFVIEVAEYFYYAAAACLVHCECGAVPIARCTQFAQLFEDDASVLVGPLPSVFKELLACEVALLNTLLGKFFYYFCLGGD